MPLYQRIDFLRNADGCIHIQMKILRYNVFSCQEIYHGRLHFRQTVCAQPAKKLNKEMKHRSLTEPVSPKYSSAQEEISWAHVS